MGYSRDSFCRFKELYETGGEEALREISRRKPNVKNRMAADVEARVVAVALEQPAWGPLRVANELAKEGLRVSANGVYRTWERHDLRTMKQRLAAREAVSAGEGRVLTESQLEALERAQREKETRGDAVDGDRVLGKKREHALPSPSKRARAASDAHARFVIRDSGFGFAIRDSRFGIRDSGFRIRDSGFRIRD